MSKSIPEDEILYLESLVDEYLQFLKTFFKEMLKFKHHNMTHYGELIRRLGPLINFWCERLEGKHKEIKAYAVHSNNRKHLSLSVMRKEALMFSNSIVGGNYLKSNFVKGQSIHDEDLKAEIDELLAAQNIDISDDYVITDKVTYRGTTFKKDCVLNLDDESETGILATLQYCCVDETGTIIFIVDKNLKKINYLDHFQAFEVESCDSELIAYPIQKVFSFPCTIHKIGNGKDLVKISRLPFD
jgi:hypothetical protein